MSFAGGGGPRPHTLEQALTLERADELTCDNLHA